MKRSWGTNGSRFQLSDCEQQNWGHAMKSKTNITAIASALFLAQATCALAQTAPGGTSVPPSGSAPGVTNPGPPAQRAAPPTASPSQAPSGAAVQSTTPPANTGPAATGSSGTVGRSGRPANLEDPKEDPVVQETEREVSKRIKSICRGC
jgi:hypothetical protein